MKIIVVFTIFFVFPSICYSEPTATTSYLLNSPLSLMDFGCYKLEKYISQQDGLENVEVGYDWDKNKIIISIIKVGTFGSDNEVKNGIEEKIKIIKRKLLVYDNKMTDFAKKHISSFFLHNGYEDKSQPKDLVLELPKYIEINVFYFGNVRKEDLYLECMSTLMEDKNFCSNNAKKNN